MPSLKDIDFRARLLGGQQLLGTFIKSPGVHAIEVLGDVGLDFVVLDAEHAPWDRGAIDLGILAARASAMAPLVRVEGVHSILSALDCGAAGVMVPHVSSAQAAREVARACRYQKGHRGFSNSTRAGGYGRLGLSAHLEACDAQTAVIAMLEDPQAVDAAPEIAATEGIDAFFLGRGDLTVALGETSTEAAAVRQAIARLVAAVRAAGKPLCAFVNKSSEIAGLRELGVSAFIVSSELGFVRQAAAAELAQFRPQAA